MPNKHPDPYDAILAEVRLAHRLYQSEIAERAGVSTRTFMRWENGRPPPAKRVPALLRAVASFDEGGAERLAAALGTSLRAHEIAAAPTAPVPSAPPPASQEAIEHALFVAAEEMDIPAARARAPLAKLFRQLAALRVDWERAAAAIAPPKNRGMLPAS